MAVNIILNKISNQESLITVHVNDDVIRWKATRQKGEEHVVNGRTLVAYSVIYQPLWILLIKKYTDFDEKDTEHGLPKLKEIFGERVFDSLKAANDFGDSIRFGAATAEEDERDLDKVHFDINLYELYVKGYLEMAKDVLTPEELESLPWGARLMTFECGIRFLMDFLQGDTYFKTAYPEHNLVRARTQFRLVQEMEDQFDEMCRIVREC